MLRLLLLDELEVVLLLLLSKDITCGGIGGDKAPEPM